MHRESPFVFGLLYKQGIVFLLASNDPPSDGPVEHRNKTHQRGENSKAKIVVKDDELGWQTTNTVFVRRTWCFGTRKRQDPKAGIDVTLHPTKSRHRMLQTQTWYNGRVMWTTWMVSLPQEWPCRCLDEHDGSSIRHDHLLKK